MSWGSFDGFFIYGYTTIFELSNMFLPMEQNCWTLLSRINFLWVYLLGNFEYNRLFIWTKVVCLNIFVFVRKYHIRRASFYTWGCGRHVRLCDTISTCDIPLRREHTGPRCCRTSLAPRLWTSRASTSRVSTSASKEEE